LIGEDDAGAALAIAAKGATEAAVFPAVARACFAFATPDELVGTSLDWRMMAGALDVFGTILFCCTAVAIEPATDRFVPDNGCGSRLDVEPVSAFVSEAAVLVSAALESITP